MKEVKIGNTVIINSHPQEVEEKVIRELFDTLNEIFRGKEECFYSLEESDELKKKNYLKEKMKQ